MNGKPNLNYGKPKKNKIYEFPYSVRNCIKCECKMIFKYDKNIKHSHCIKCGFHGEINMKWKGTIYNEKLIEE